MLLEEEVQSLHGAVVVAAVAAGVGVGAGAGAAAGGGDVLGRQGAQWPGPQQKEERCLGGHC